MGKLYERTEIYDFFETDKKREATRVHWQKILAGKRIHTLLDVSIGTGNLTLPLTELGIALTGSDLSQAMLDRCGEKAAEQGSRVTLIRSDFRELDRHIPGQFDCVASTGNALPYVPNSEIGSVLEQMDSRIKPGGYLYFDLRNWDKILETHQRFYVYQPQFVGDTRVNLIQVWDHEPDGTITFHLLYAFEQNNRIIQREEFAEHYFPVSRKLLLEKLEDMGYANIEIFNHPAQFEHISPEKADWYCMIARKPGA